MNEECFQWCCASGGKQHAEAIWASTGIKLKHQKSKFSPIGNMSEVLSPLLNCGYFVCFLEWTCVLDLDKFGYRNICSEDKNGYVV